MTSHHFYYCRFLIADDLFLVPIEGRDGEALWGHLGCWLSPGRTEQDLGGQVSEEESPVVSPQPVRAQETSGGKHVGTPYNNIPPCREAVGKCPHLLRLLRQVGLF